MEVPLSVFNYTAFNVVSVVLHEPDELDNILFHGARSVCENRIISSVSVLQFSKSGLFPMILEYTESMSMSNTKFGLPGEIRTPDLSAPNGSLWPD